MTKKLFDGLRLVAVALSLAGAATGCSKDTSDGSSLGDSEVGSIGFNLTLPNGAVVDPITYEITGPTTKSGTIPTSGSGTAFSVTIDGLKAGSGYTIKLVGKQTMGAADCFGTAMFSVTSNQTTTVNVKLSCPGIRKAGTGKILVDGTVNICAVVDGAIGTPEMMGTVIALESMASNEDMAPTPSTITYEWTAPSGSGSFSSTTTANPKFTCAVDGAVKLNLKVSDGDCGDNMDVDVTCAKSGTPVAGTGGGGTGGTTGGTGGTTAGTGGTTAGTGGDSGGTGGTTGGTGGTTAGAGGTTGGTGGTTGGTGGTTGGTGEMSAACRSCVTAAPECMQGLVDYESSPKYALGKALETCVRTNKCANTMGGYALMDCYCGTTEFGACTSGTMPGNGVCKAQIEAATESTVATEITARVTNPTYAAGLLDAELGCESAICNALTPVCDL